MDQNGQRRSARLAGSRSHAQAYVTNHREHNTISQAHIIRQNRLTRPNLPHSTNSQAHVEAHQERTEPMLSPLANPRGPSTFSTFPVGPLQQHPNVPQTIRQTEPNPQPEVEPEPELQRELFNFWARQNQEVENTTNFRTHSLPLSRIKRIMKRDKDVGMISADACVVFSKACEIFIKELTTRSWVHAEENRRRTLQRGDIATTIAQTQVFDFLVDSVPLDNTMEHNIHSGLHRGGGSSGSVRIAPNCDAMPPPPRNVRDETSGYPRLITRMGPTPQDPVGNENLVTGPVADQVWPQQQNDDTPPSFDEN
ncbi:Nuclear transcription factor Y subunit C-2, partial [Mucuna pruriens]